jgi:SAM-dependent methyltransferase
MEQPLLPPSDLLAEHVRNRYLSSGEETRARLIKHCGLEPDHHVLDVGCGAGRVALALTSYLTSEGSYEGFDVIAPQVEWCMENITPRYPNFRFQVANVFSQTYNRKGATKGMEYRFPYSDDSFDLSLLFSVFTHMLPDDVEHYLSEIARVLKPGGRCLATFLLLNEESLSLIEADETRSDPAWNSRDARFSHDFGSYRVSDPEYPERVVAYDEGFVLEMLERNGLRVRQPILYGWWPGRDKDGRTGQDNLVLDLV